MDHEVSISGDGGRHIGAGEGFDPADLCGGACRDTEGDSVEGSHPHLCFNTTIYQCIEAGAIFEGEDIERHTATVSGAEEAVLGQTFLGGWVLRAHDWQCYR